MRLFCSLILTLRTQRSAEFAETLRQPFARRFDLRAQIAQRPFLDP